MTEMFQVPRTNMPYNSRLEADARNYGARRSATRYASQGEH